MKYIFKEEKLCHDFAKEKVTLAKEWIHAGISFEVIGMPGVGVSNFLRFLSLLPIGHTLYIDVAALPSLTKESLLRSLLLQLPQNDRKSPDGQLLEACNQALLNASKKEKVIILLNRFQHLKGVFSSEFFSNLRALQNSNKGNIIFLLSGNRSLAQTHPEALIGSNVNLLKTLYLQPYSYSDLKQLATLGTSDFKTIKEKDLIYSLCGGHGNLLQLLLRTDLLENPLLDPFVALQLKTVYENLTQAEKVVVRRIALNRQTNAIPQYLLSTGILVQKNLSFHFFSPLFKEYILSQSPLKLSRKEEKLFYLLKKNLGKIITKERLFAYLWVASDSGATEWALNALIYRLRKNPTFTQTGFIIESHKGIGYRMVKV